MYIPSINDETISVEKIENAKEKTYDHVLGITSSTSGCVDLKPHSQQKRLKLLIGATVTSRGQLRIQLQLLYGPWLKFFLGPFYLLVFH